MAIMLLCLSVCPHNKTKTAETKITHQLTLGQKVTGSQCVKALLLAAWILEQLFQRGCSFALPPIVLYS